MDCLFAITRIISSSVLLSEERGASMMKLRLSVIAFADIDVPKELEDEPLYEIYQKLQDDISEIDCGQCFNIDTAPYRIIEESGE